MNHNANRLIQFLKNDEEIKALRIAWQKVYDTPFPPYNWDEYNGIEDYKGKIRDKIENAEM